MIDSVATFEAALLATEDWENLARLVLGFPDAFDDEKGVAAAALSSPEELDWGPSLSLILTRILIRRMTGLEERFRHRVIDASAKWLTDAIAEGDHEKAEAAARIAFNQAENLVTEREG